MTGTAVALVGRPNADETPHQGPNETAETAEKEMRWQI